MNARSWISRGLASLMAASLLAIGGMAIAADHADAGRRTAGSGGDRRRRDPGADRARADADAATGSDRAGRPRARGLQRRPSRA